MSLFIFIEAILVWLVFDQMNPGLCQIVFRLQSLGVLVRGREVVIHQLFIALEWKLIRFIKETQLLFIITKQAPKLFLITPQKVDVNVNWSTTSSQTPYFIIFQPLFLNLPKMIIRLNFNRYRYLLIMNVRKVPSQNLIFINDLFLEIYFQTFTNFI